MREGSRSGHQHTNHTTPRSHTLPLTAARAPFTRAAAHVDERTNLAVDKPSLCTTSRRTPFTRAAHVDE